MGCPPAPDRSGSQVTAASTCFALNIAAAAGPSYRRVVAHNDHDQAFGLLALTHDRSPVCLKTEKPGQSAGSGRATHLPTFANFIADFR